MDICIETERLKLFPVTRELWEDIVSGKSSRDVVFNPEWPSEEEKDLYSGYVRKLDSNPQLYGWGFWIVTCKESCLIIGDLCFKSPPDENGELEIGYGIITGQRNKGYAHEAARGLMQWGFFHKEVKKIKADCLHTNAASRRVLEKLGMKKVSEDQESIYWALERK